MKKLCLLLCGLFIAILSYGQTYALSSTGEVIKVAEKRPERKPDKVYAIKDDITFYISEKGAVYYWKMSKKSGKLYKVYLKRKTI